MKFLHTSDWHLGRSLHGLSLHDAQCGVVEQIVEIARQESVDCVLIAGDVFDRAIPPVDAVALFSSALAQLSEFTSVVVIAGNHDSAIRLGFGSHLHRREVSVVTDINQIGQPIEIGDVLVYPIPYLDPDQARLALSPADQPLPRSHEAVTAAATERIRADISARRISGDSSKVVVVAHAFVVGGEPSESERDIRVGGVDSVAAGNFVGVDYVALGHLHGPQVIERGAAGAIVRYSGSPLRYSFSEAQQRKTVTLFELADQGVHDLQMIDIQQPRAMAVLSGSLDQILEPANVTRHCDHWVQVTVTDAARPDALNRQIKSAFPHALSIRHQPATSDRTRNSARINLITDPLAISEQFVTEVTNAEPSVAETLVLRRAYETALSPADS